MTEDHRFPDTAAKACKTHGLGKKAMRHFSPLKGWIALCLSLVAVVICVWVYTRVNAQEAWPENAEVPIDAGRVDAGYAFDAMPGLQGWRG